MYIYYSVRYDVPQSDNFESLDDLIESAASDLEFNSACPDYVTDETGTVVWDHQALRRQVWEYIDLHFT